MRGWAYRELIREVPSSLWIKSLLIKVCRKRHKKGVMLAGEGSNTGIRYLGRDPFCKSDPIFHYMKHVSCDFWMQNLIRQCQVNWWDPLHPFAFWSCLINQHRILKGIINNFGTACQESNPKPSVYKADNSWNDRASNKTYNKTNAVGIFKWIWYCIVCWERGSL